MTTVSVSVTGAADPGPAFYTSISTYLLAEGFTLADTVVIGSRTHKVMKSAAADNSHALDWYLDISYPTTGTGALLMCAFEGFVAATDLATNGPVMANITTTDGTTHSRYGTTGSALETNWTNTSTQTGIRVGSLTASTYGYIGSITMDRVILNLTIEAAALHYVGFFEPTADHAAEAGAALYPLVTAHFSTAAADLAPNSSTTGTIALSRAPKYTSINWAAHCCSTVPWMEMGGLVGGGGPHVATAKRLLARRPIVTGWNTLVPSAGTSAPAGGIGIVGHFYDLANSWTDGSIVRGDTLTDASADTWWAVDDTSALGLWFKAV